MKKNVSGNRSPKGRQFRRLAARQTARFRPPIWLRSLAAGFVVLLVLIAIPAGIVFAVREWYFIRNPAFTIRTLNIVSGDSVTQDFIREWMHVHEGIGLFSMDIHALQQRFSREAPHVKHLRIQRRLPDTLEIRVIERQPVARIRRNGSLVVDEEGLVFVRRGGLDVLPVLTGGPDTMRSGMMVVGVEIVSLEPSARIQGMGMAAIELIRLNDEPGFQLPINEVDVAHGDYILVRLMDRRQIKLSWEGMGLGTRASQYRLYRRLQAVINALADPVAKRHRIFDATVDDRHIYGQ